MPAGVGGWRNDQTRPVEPLRGVPRDMTSPRTTGDVRGVGGLDSPRLEQDRIDRVAEIEMPASPSKDARTA